MKCPECGAWTIIMRSKESPIFGYTRRRECANEHRFTTQERVIAENAIKEYKRLSMLKAKKMKGTK